MEVTKRLQVFCLGETSPRLNDTLMYALEGVAHERVDAVGQLRAGRVLLAVSIDAYGGNPAIDAVLYEMRRNPSLLQGCVTGAIVDGAGGLYTKSIGQMLIQAANTSGAICPGRSLVEATGSLQNFSILARTQQISVLDAYKMEAKKLVHRLLQYQKPSLQTPSILALHATNIETSNTYMLWRMVKQSLHPGISVQEVALLNGSVVDCAGCNYSTCLHLGEQGNCFYGGVIVNEVYPALMSCHALVMLCPNYNDAIDANCTASINRLTALYRKMSFYDKSLFGIVVSGYSGGDIVARQLLSALSLNKTFQLPPRFCMMETANDPNSIAKAAGIEGRANAFAQAVSSHLLGWENA